MYIYIYIHAIMEAIYNPGYHHNDVNRTSCAQVHVLPATRPLWL